MNNKQDQEQSFLPGDAGRRAGQLGRDEKTVPKNVPLTDSRGEEQLIDN